MISILKADKLNLVNEATLVDLVKEYIHVRDQIPDKLPETAQEKAGPELWALLTKAEQESRETEWDEEEKKKVEEKLEA